MPFTARILIQGAATYVPHEDLDRLLVLFPDQEHAIARGVEEPGGTEMCRHFALVQMDARALDPALPEGLWLSLDVAKHWVGFQSDSQVEMKLPDGKIDGLAPVEEMLENLGLSEYAALDERALPGPGMDPDLLKAGVFLQAGQVGPLGAYEGLFHLWSNAAGIQTEKEISLSSVIRVELGEVSALQLKLRPFGGDALPPIELLPPGIELDVWVRHFCDVDRPDPKKGVPSGSDLDPDFVLNYALRKDLEGLLAVAKDRLPVPAVPENWEPGTNIGGDPRQCTPSQNTKVSYVDPI